LAANVAAAEGLIVASPALAARLGIPIKVDLRGRFATYADGLEWVWKTYRKKLNPHLCLIARDIAYPAAYAVQWRGMIFWPSGPVDGKQSPPPNPLPSRKGELGLRGRKRPSLSPPSGTGYPLGAGWGVGSADPVREKALVARIMAQMAPNA